MNKFSTKAPKVRVAKLMIQGGLGSKSAKRVAEALSESVGYRVLRTTKSVFKFPKKFLKYGQGVDKLTQYKWFAANNIPALEFTEDPSKAADWLYEGHDVFGRKLLNASCGNGIVVFIAEECDGGHSLPGDYPNVPVWTKYKKKKREFRVHVYKDQVVRVVEKKLRSDWNGPRDSKIRNLANGYVFCSCDNEPEGLRELAIKSSKVVGSDFRGVDIGYNEKLNELFVIEVNSAPGIEGSNVAAYVNAILA